MRAACPDLAVTSVPAGHLAAAGTQGRTHRDDPQLAPGQETLMAAPGCDAHCATVTLAIAPSTFCR
jgi:hypothetical protein